MGSLKIAVSVPQAATRSAGWWSASPAAFLLRPVDGASLALFRSLFGALMVWEVVRYFNLGRITRYYVDPGFYFTYDLFPFLAPLPETGMVLVFLAMGLAALGLTLGLFYRASALLFFLLYTYVFLLDKAQYNNHFYLICLLSFLLIFVDARRWLAADRLWQPGLRSNRVPYWHLFIFRAQLVIVYFYAGVAKLNGDWLRGEPVRAWLAARFNYPVLGPFFTTEWTTFLFSYGGLFFDLFIGFLLWWRRTRPFAVVAVLGFHLMNEWLFSIGIFPYLMLASTVLFAEPDWPRRVVARLGERLGLASNRPAAAEAVGRAPGQRAAALGFVALFLAVQVLAPLRHWLYPGNVSWTEQGHRFAWHMKLRDKESRIVFFITDPDRGETWQADLRADLTLRQIGKMASRPDMILQYAHHLKRTLQRAGLERPIIKVEAMASLNGRPAQRLVDPTVNLAEMPYRPWAHSAWILPLETQLSTGPPLLPRYLALVAALFATLGLALGLYRLVEQAPSLRRGFRGGAGGLIQVALQLAVLMALGLWLIAGGAAWLRLALAAAALAVAWGVYRARRFPAGAGLAAAAGLFALMSLIVVVQT